jgi:hypothetical protein
MPSIYARSIATTYDGSTAPNKMVSDVAYRAYQITHSVFLEPAFDMKADMCSAANRR